MLCGIDIVYLCIIIFMYLCICVFVFFVYLCICVFILYSWGSSSALSGVRSTLRDAFWQGVRQLLHLGGTWGRGRGAWEAGSKRQKEWMQHLPTHTILAQSSKWSTSLQILSSKFLSIWPMSLVMQRELQLWNRCLCVYFDFAPDVRRSKQHQAGTAYPWSRQPPPSYLPPTHSKMVPRL